MPPDDLQTLSNQVISGWYGVEMAIRDEGPDGEPVFADEDAPLLQLMYVDLQLNDERLARLTTRQSDDAFGLILRSGCAEEEAAGHEGIFRHRGLSELPVGEVSSVHVTSSENGDVVEVALVVGGHELVLIAGEVHETMTGSLHFHRFDESVLVFADRRAFESIDWIPPRT